MPSLCHWGAQVRFWSFKRLSFEFLSRSDEGVTDEIQSLSQSGLSLVSSHLGFSLFKTLDFCSSTWPCFILYFILYTESLSKIQTLRYNFTPVLCLVWGIFNPNFEEEPNSGPLLSTFRTATALVTTLHLNMV